ncbi:hypothetical protein DPMN_132502 [Dreissena polymorpha]|uniref:Uncharacterized protein n=1 Tax=Dreissena polymorpha TaxID=45954 RepID=A0A9D4FSM5_DREPO|nr:hypothetical protein DPMN_132502 [Dreissena polymorpha]
MSHNWRNYRKKPQKIVNNAVISAFFTKVSPLQQSVPERSETVTASPCQGQLSLAQLATVSLCHEVITLTKSVIVCPSQDDQGKCLCEIV